MEDSIYYIRLLVIRKHLGRLTPEESIILNKYLETSEEARQIEQEVQAIPQEEFAVFTSSIDLDQQLENVLEAENARKRRMARTRVRILAGTAAAALICWGILTFTNDKQPSGGSANIAGNLAGNTATLKLADGRIINLDDSGHQQISAGGTNLNNNNRVLKFNAATNGGNGNENSWNTLTVPAKLDYKVELSDGTIVWLNSTTKFRFPFTFSGNDRKVFIEEGEAYFKISRNVEQPFIVQTSQGEIQVLGTEFNVNAYTAGQVVTSLVNGKVAVKTGTERKELVPGVEAVIDEGHPIAMQQFDPAITLSWREGLHYFNNASISAVAIMLERWFDTPLIIDNPQVANVQFRGRLYRRKPLQSFIDQMNLTGEVTFYWKMDQLHCK